MKTASSITSAQRTALAAVLDGKVRLGVEQNAIRPRHVSPAALGECFEAGYCHWSVHLPGGHAKLTDAGLEAMA